MLSRKKFLQLNAFHILIDGLYDSMPLLLSFMIISFGAGEKEVGLIISLAIMASTVAGLSSIFFSRRFGFQRTLSLIALLYGLGFLSNAFSQHLYFAGLCFIIAVAGHGVFHNLAFSYLTLNSERRLLGKVMSDFTAVGDIGRVPLVSFAGFVAAATLLEFPCWRFVCLLYGAGALVFAGYLFCSSFGAGEGGEADGDGQAARENLSKDRPKRQFPAFSLLRDRQLALAMGASILNAFSGEMIFTFLPLLLFAKGIDPKIIGTFALGFTLGSFVGKLACGRLVDRFGAKKVFAISEVMLAGLLVLLVMGHELPVIIGISLLLGIVARGTVPVVHTIIAEPVREDQHYDDVFSINTFLRGGTCILTPLLFGLVASRFGIDWIYIIMAVAAALAAIPVLLMGKNTRLENPAES